MITCNFPKWRCIALSAAVIAISSVALGGPDLFTCLLGGTSPQSGFVNWGSVNNSRAFSVLTVACNQGDTVVRWHDGTEGPANAHPVIASNLFRLRNGRFEQIGMSWVKHGYSTGQITFCTTCQPGGTTYTLGVGCCDAYDGSLNGSQVRLGPRSEINAANGDFPFPFCTPPGGLNCPGGFTEIDRRLQVKQVDLDPSAGVLYFFEVHYVTSDDATLASPRTDFNNASHRRFSINAQGDMAQWEENTVHYEPGIKGWKRHGLGPNTPDPNVQETFVDVPGDGRFWLAAKATDLGGGVWNYEYAVQNFNSDRSARLFSVPLQGCQLNVSSTGFHDVDYHSGEVYSLADWTPVQSSNAIAWSTQTHAQNVNANALRWGTIYNFRFNVNRPPTNGLVSLGLFKPGSPGSVLISTIVPTPTTCPADAAPAGGDCQVNVTDLLAVINTWGNCPAPPSNCPADVAPPGGDGLVNVSDLLAVINNWGACP